MLTTNMIAKKSLIIRWYHSAGSTVDAIPLLTTDMYTLAAAPAAAFNRDDLTLIGS
jgi:hypothetical protein